MTDAVVVQCCRRQGRTEEPCVWYFLQVTQGQSAFLFFKTRFLEIFDESCAVSERV